MSENDTMSVILGVDPNLYQVDYSAVGTEQATEGPFFVRNVATHGILANLFISDLVGGTISFFATIQSQ
jgi:hypothetical protein